MYSIAGNTIVGTASLGAIGLDWSVGGFAVDRPTGSVANSDSSTSQLVQAMAGFGGSASDTSSAAPFPADTSQPPFLASPQHA